MTQFFQHTIDLTENNLNKLKKGAKTALTHAQIGSGMTIHLDHENTKRIEKNHAHGKGSHLKLSTEEIEENKKAGTGFGNFMAKTFGVHHATRKLINTGKAIARATLPAVLEAGATLSGNPELAPLAGVAGSQLASSSLLHNGKGLFKQLHKAGFHKIGLNKKNIMKFGKQALHKAIDVGSSQLAQRIQDPNLKQALDHATTVSHLATDGNVGQIKEHAMNTAYASLPAAKDMLHKAVVDHTGSHELANHVADHAYNYAADAIQMHGQGLAQKRLSYGSKKNRGLIGGAVVSEFQNGFKKVGHPDLNSFVSFTAPTNRSTTAPNSNMEIAGAKRPKRVRGGSFR